MGTAEEDGRTPMTVDEALTRARKKYPDLRLGQLIYNAVVASHPEVRPKRITKKEQITKNKARTVDIIFSLTDKQMEKALGDMESNLRTVNEAD